MKILNMVKKLNKLKNLWRQKGTKRLWRYLYQRAALTLKARRDYQKWIAKNKITSPDIVNAQKQIDTWHLQPKFSVIMPVYNTAPQWLKKAIESVQNQIYQNWELCIADDASSKPHIRSILTEYSKLEPRIKVIFRTENGNISAASNSALSLATGDYIALLDHDDELAIDALFENAKLINQYPEADFIYSDEDKIDTKDNRFSPCFKPDWSPEYLYSCMYTCHLSVYRTSLIREIGGFRSEYDGSQDYDLVLRVTERTKNIYHISKILYHWRAIPSSAASGSQAKPEAYTAGKKALEAMLERSSYSGHVEETINPGIYRVRRNIIDYPLVSIIIFGCGKKIKAPSSSLYLLENCIHSIKQLSTYRNYEIIVVHGSDISESILQKLAAPNLHRVYCTKLFNLSTQINTGAAEAKGQFLLLLSEDTKVINPEWLESMVELAQQTEIGAVGAKLLSPDKKIQHVGVIITEGNPCHVFYGLDSDHPGYYCSNIVNKNYLAVTGACLMIRQNVFQQIRGMDEDFPTYYYDTNLCLKAHQAGYRNVVTPYAQLIQYESISRQKGIKDAEWKRLNDKWKDYFKTLGNDPYFNKNLSSKSSNFEIF
jgi:glycosyltransferase involved in cell wall biosynthesis